MTPSLPARLAARIDPAARSAAGRMARLWKAMATWSILVWTTVAVVLTPLFSAVLSWSWLRGGEEVVGNEALLAWAATPRGLAWIVLAGGLGLVGAVLHFSGIFHLVTADLEGDATSVPVIALRLLPETPSLIRLCLAAVATGMAAAIPLAGGLAGVHAIFLSAHDINYYLAEQPAAWWRALATAAALLLVWGAAVAGLAGRSVLALPAYLDGHRPLSAAIRRSWHHTRGEGVRIARAVGAALAGWLVVRAGLDAAAVAAGSTLVQWIASHTDALGPVAAAVGGWALVSAILDATIAFLGIAFVSTLLTKLYHEDTELHQAAETRAVRPARRSMRERATRWLRPPRSLWIAAGAVIASAVSGAVLLERIPEPGPVAIVAHRAGPAPSPENSLAALERSIAAGAEWAEIDVQLTRDGVPVVIHDADLMRVTGEPRRVAEVDARDLTGRVQRPDDGTPPEERRIATLTAFVERARGRIGLVVELKYYGWDPELARSTVLALRDGDAPGRMMLMSLERRAIRQLRVLDVDVPVGFAAAAAVGDPSRLPVDFLALSRGTATFPQLKAARARAVDVHVWTVNRAVEMAEVIQDGADGLITDRPRLAGRVQEKLAEMSAVSRLALRFGHVLTEPWDEDVPPDEL